MSLEVKKSKSETIQDERERIVELFHIYIVNEFGSETWEDYMSDPKFDNFMTQMHPKYGDSVFKYMADYVSETENIPIKDLLVNFGEFVNTYY